MFIVMEIQTGDSVATIVNAYADRNTAENKYHTILAAAATSSVPKHGAVMLTDEGVRLKNECYIHEQEEPEEEPNE